KYIFKKLKKTPLKRFVTALENKAMSKSDQIQKYAYWGLLLFVGIPLPGTGAWTGSLIAVLLDMDIKKTFAVEVVGVIMAGIIISIFSYGLLGTIIQ
ncbi:MAG: small multi-drug export protein, partial [Clostridiales bacterium]|nr:small multi-drug export protein [Clostridiales bacterium]